MRAIALTGGERLARLPGVPVMSEIIPGFNHVEWFAVVAPPRTPASVVELISEGGEPFVVGDDDQSIYRFRGASRASLERFRMHFPSALTVTLGRNHRSSRRIVTAASALIANSPERLPAFGRLLAEVPADASQARIGL